MTETVHAGDHRFAGFLLDLPDAVFELQAMRGDIPGCQRRIDGAQLPNKSGARLFIDSAPSGSVVFRQGIYCPA